MAIARNFSFAPLFAPADLIFSQSARRAVNNSRPDFLVAFLRTGLPPRVPSGGGWQLVLDIGQRSLEFTKAKPTAPNFRQTI